MEVYPKKAEEALSSGGDAMPNLSGHGSRAKQMPIWRQGQPRMLREARKGADCEMGFDAYAMD